MEDIERRWREAKSRPFHHSPLIDDDGMKLGFGTILMHRSDGKFDLARDADRVFCLLSVAGRREPRPGTMAGFERALRCLEQGDRALAHIHIAYTRPPRIDDIDDARRLFLAEAVLETDMTPRDFAKAIGLELPNQAIRKYDENEARNPIGDGVQSGRWTKESAGQSVSYQTKSRVPAALAARAPSLVDTLAPEALTWLERLASRLALPTALFGAVFIPSSNDGVAAEGDVPNRPGLGFRLDRDTGILRLFSKDDPNPDNALVTQLGHDGLYRDIETGVPFARALGDTAVLLDLDRAPALAEDPADEKDKPKLCPDPSKDQLGSRRLFDILYEQYVRDTVNPQRRPQLPPGLTFALPAEVPSGWVHYDDCREADGAMIEAKRNYAPLMRSEFGRQLLRKKWTEQARKQIDASAGRRVEWYFHDPSAAALARSLFTPDSEMSRIGIHVLPFPGGVPKPNPRVKL